jgi:cytochrome c
MKYRFRMLVAGTALCTVAFVGCSGDSSQQVADAGTSSSAQKDPAAIARPDGIAGGGAPTASAPASSTQSSSPPPGSTSPQSPPPGSSSGMPQSGPGGPPSGSSSPYGGAGGMPQSGPGGPPSGGSSPYAGAGMQQSGPGGPPSGSSPPSGGAGSPYAGQSQSSGAKRPSLAGGGGGVGDAGGAPQMIGAGSPNASIYETQVRPLLEQHCYQCHRGSSGKGKLQLDTPEGIKRGGAHGAIFVSGQPAESMMIKMVKHEGDKPMPPKSKLQDSEIAILENWITVGAPMPQSAPGGEVAQPTEVPFQERGKLSFQNGHEEDGFKLTQAFILSDPDQGEEYLENMKWSPLRKRPALGVRIAVGVDLDAPSDLSDYRPIGSKQNLPGGGNAGFNDSGGGATLSALNRGGSQFSANSGPVTGLKTIETTTGEMGKYLVRMTQDMFDSGDLGTLFTGLEDLVVAGSADTGGAQTGTMGFPGSGGYPGGGGSSPPPGSFGEADSVGSAGGSVPGAPPSSAPRQSKSAVRTNHNRLTPGLTFLGTATTKELQRKAEKEGFDVLIVFEVKVSQNKRSNMISNTCRAKAFATGEGKVLSSSKELNNLEVQKKSVDEEVEKALNPFMARLKEAIAVKDIPPAITADIIKSKRLASLTSDKAIPVLDSLTELKFWRYKQFLNDEELEAAFGAILSPADAKKLVSGSEDERIAVMKKFVK